MMQHTVDHASLGVQTRSLRPTRNRHVIDVAEIDMSTRRNLLRQIPNPLIEVLLVPSGWEHTSVFCEREEYF